MCLAVPMKILTIKEKTAIVDLDGLQRKINLGLMENLKIGDYVVVHAGFAIQKLDEDAAQETIAALRELRKSLQD